MEAQADLRHWLMLLVNRRRYGNYQGIHLIYKNTTQMLRFCIPLFCCFLNAKLCIVAIDMWVELGCAVQDHKYNFVLQDDKLPREL